MLLTITNTCQPATDLGFLLRKNPARVHTFDVSFGKAHVFYPEATAERCTAALLLDVDPVGLVRNRRGPAGEGAALEQYVNDRPYVASSFMSVAMSRVFGSAMAGSSTERPELVDAPLPLTARIAVLPARGGEGFVRGLFGPLGYSVQVHHHHLEEEFSEWGESSYYNVELFANVPLKILLTHLYVLIPVLDADKHYWISQDEVEKLLRRGEGWLQAHPLREEIVKRYLRGNRRLTRDALLRLTEDDAQDPEAEQEKKTEQEAEIEKPIKLNVARLQAVTEELKACAAKRVLDLGCGEGRLIRELLKEKQFEEIVGVDVSYRSLEMAGERMHFDRMPPMQRSRVRLLQGSLMYRDRRLEGFDAAAVVEVIEHLDEPRLAAFERVLFECARPSHIVITTPNAEYNVRFATLPTGQMRHKDHRFEWTRAQFENWGHAVAERFGYTVTFKPIGNWDDEVGAPTQMGVFTR